MREIERWPEWTTTVTSIERLDRGPLAAESRVRIRQPKLPPTAWEITELDEGQRSFTWVARSPGAEVAARHRVETNGAGSRAMLSVQYAGPIGVLTALLTRGLNERCLAIEASGLKARSEGAKQ